MRKWMRRHLKSVRRVREHVLSSACHPISAATLNLMSLLTPDYYWISTLAGMRMVVAVDCEFRSVSVSENWINIALCAMYRSQVRDVNRYGSFVRMPARTFTAANDRNLKTLGLKIAYYSFLAISIQKRWQSRVNFDADKYPPNCMNRTANVRRHIPLVQYWFIGWNFIVRYSRKEWMPNRNGPWVNQLPALTMRPGENSSITAINEVFLSSAEREEKKL